MFFVIPVSHESSTVRRQPWVSYLIIAVNALIFFFFTHSAMKQWETRKLLMEIYEYGLEHPYTELDPELKMIFPEKVLTQYDKARSESREFFTRPYEEDLAAEQAHLDELTEAFLSIYQDDSYQRWGYIPDRKGHLYTLITNFFFHSGLMHLLSNMFLFFLCGPFIEDRWGRAIFLAFYMVSGVVATLAHGLLTDTPNLPLVGASGAIAGVMGAFLILFFHTRIRFFYLLFLVFRIFKGSFHAPAYLVLPLWFAQQTYNALTADNSPVAFWAHVAGFLFGAGIALVMKSSRMEERYISPTIENKITVFEAHPLYERALEQRSDGQSQQAIGTLRRILKEAPNDINAMNTLFEVHLDEKDAEAVRATGSKLMMAFIKRGQLEHAVETYDNMKIEGSYVYPQPEVMFNLAGALEKAGEVDEAYRTYDELIRAYPHHLLTLKSLIKLAKSHLERGQNYRQVFSYFVLAKHHPLFDPNLEAMVEAGIRQARLNGGPSVAQLKATDVEGLANYARPLSQGTTELRMTPSRLVGLSAKGLKLKPAEGSPFDLHWPGVILLSVAIVKKLPESSSGVERNVILIDLFNTKIENGNKLQYLGFRLSSDQLPIQRLFKGNPPPARAYGAFINLLHTHVPSPSIPSSEALKRFKLPRYGSTEDYEDSLAEQLIADSASMDPSPVVYAQLH